MTKDEALDLALEALEIAQNNLAPSRGSARAYGDGELWDRYETAITAIKQARALDKKADNARELGLDYEPVQPVISAGLITPAMRAGPTTEQKEQMVRAMQSAYPAAQPAPAQEPVMLEMDGKQLTLGEALDEAIAATERSASKRLNAVLVAAKNALYTTPPAAQRQWVGLTPEWIWMWLRNWCDRHPSLRQETYNSLYKMVSDARAIEAKLREKNNR